jgi:hypothetical protein
LLSVRIFALRKAVIEVTAVPPAMTTGATTGATVLMDGIGALDDRLGVLDRLRVPVEIDVVAVTIATELRCWPRPS